MACKGVGRLGKAMRRVWRTADSFLRRQSTALAIVDAHGTHGRVKHKRMFLRFTAPDRFVTRTAPLNPAIPLRQETIIY